MLQPRDRNAVAAAVNQYGVAPGARRMMDWEEEAAEQALATGLYVTYRSSPRMDCARVGPNSKCFCGHLYSEHSFLSKKSIYPRCHNCECTRFEFIPRRPEEVGDWWLVRRKGFNVHTWRAKCKCGHSHEEHHPVTKRCRCGCPHFQSNFACVACDKLWEDHETHFETTADRLAAGLSVGDDFRPLAADQEIRGQVFPSSGTGRVRDTPSQHAASGASAFQPSRLRPSAVPASRAEKSVQIMHESSGGRIKGQGTVNAYGKVADPPREWLFGGGPAGECLEGHSRHEPQAGTEDFQGRFGDAGRGLGRISSASRTGGRGGAGRATGGLPKGGYAVPTVQPKQSLGALLLQSGQRVQEDATSWQAEGHVVPEADDGVAIASLTCPAQGHRGSLQGTPSVRGQPERQVGVFHERRLDREGLRPGSNGSGGLSRGFKAVYD